MKVLLIGLPILCFFFPQRYYGALFFMKSDTGEISLGNLTEIRKIHDNNSGFFVFSDHLSAPYVDIASSILGLKVENKGRFNFATNDFIYSPAVVNTITVEGIGEIK